MSYALMMDGWLTTDSATPERVMRGQGDGKKTEDQSSQAPLCYVNTWNAGRLAYQKKLYFPMPNRVIKILI